MKQTILFLIPNGDISYKEDNDGTMCGKAFKEDSMDSPASPQTRALYVRFESGSFTKWHWHTGIQILLVKSGIGFVEQEGFPRLILCQVIGFIFLKTYGTGTAPGRI